MAKKKYNVEGYYIFRAWITGKNGERIYPTPPKKAFRFWVTTPGKPKQK